jgi:hypothetical protein
MTPIVIHVSNEEAERLNKRAGESGYETIQGYLLALIEQDMNGDSDDEDEIDKVTLHADFKQAFKEVLQGKFNTREEANRLRRASTEE